MDKLGQVAEQYKAKLMKEAKEKSLVSLVEAGESIAKRQKHIVKLKNWENVLSEQRQKLEKKILGGTDKNLVRLQRNSIAALVPSLLILLKDNCELDYINYSQIESIFRNIEWLVSWCSHAESAETFERTSKSFFSLIEASNFGQKDKVDNLTRQLREQKAKFHQDNDLTRESLFMATIPRYFKVRQGIKAKRGYPLVTALEDENKENHYYSDKEFDHNYNRIVSHFATWRTRNKDYILEIEKHYTGVMSKKTPV